MQWTEKDIEGGVSVTKRRSETNPHFQIPSIIIRVPSEVSGKGWGVCELSDGLLMGLSGGKFGTKAELAVALTEMGYVPVPKMIFERGIETLPENRFGLPALILTYSKP